MLCRYYVFPRSQELCDTWLSLRSESCRVKAGLLGMHGYGPVWQYRRPSLPRQGITRIWSHLCPNSRPAYREVRHRTSVICVAPFHAPCELHDGRLRQESLCRQFVWLLSGALPDSRRELRLQPGLRLPSLRCFLTSFWSVLQIAVRLLSRK